MLRFKLLTLSTFCS